MDSDLRGRSIPSVLTESQTLRRLLAVFLLVVFGIYLLRTAWISQRAYLNFRLVENMLHGYGLGFNPGERVLPVSQPLWPVILSGIYAISLSVPAISIHSQLYFVTIALNLLFSVVAAWVFLRHASISVGKMLVGFTPLILSKAYMDYSTSGLENPLIHLLILIFVLRFLRSTEPERSKTAAQWDLVVLNLVGLAVIVLQWELILLIMPVLLYVVAAHRRTRSWRLFAASFGIPMVLWAAFTTFFYGSPLPNMYVARFHAGVGPGRLIRQGVMYLLHTVDFDPMSLLVMAFSSVVVLIQRKRAYYPLLLGMLGSLILILLVGGDSLGGRMFSPLVLVGALLLAAIDLPITRAGQLALLAALALGIFTTRSPIQSSVDYSYPEPDHRGILDGRGVDYPQTGLMRLNRVSEYPPDSQWADDDWVFSQFRELVVLGESETGFKAYQLGPEVYVLADTGLTDVLLARLPSSDRVVWDLDSMKREIPDGYRQAILEDQPAYLACAELAGAYEVLRELIHDAPFAPDRLRALQKFIFSSGKIPGELNCPA